MSLKVQFRCGHDGKLKEGQEPICGQCGRHGVSRCFAPAPRITGTASGPLVKTQDLAPATVSLTDSPLRLKPLETSDAG